MTAIVANCHYNGLAIVRELGRHGVEVIAMDSRRSVGTVSRYGRFRLVPDPATDEDGFIRHLMELGPTFAVRPVLFPTNDSWALAMARSRTALSRFYAPCVAELEVVELLLQKDAFAAWAVGHDLPVPRTWALSETDRIPSDAFPVVAKPARRRSAGNRPEAFLLERGLDAARLTILNSRAEVATFRARHPALDSHLVLQKFVPGTAEDMFTVGVYARAPGEVVAAFTGRKIRGYPPGFGDCMLGQVAAVPDELQELVRRVCRELRYSGIAEFEFKREPRSGRFWLIEINPRSWSWIGITPAAGVSLPWIAYSDLTGNRVTDIPSVTLPDGSVKWVRLVEDAVNCLWRYRKEGHPEWSLSPAQWWRSLKADRRVTAEFAMDDPVPGVYALLSVLRSGLRRSLRGLRAR